MAGCGGDERATRHDSENDDRASVRAVILEARPLIAEVLEGAMARGGVSVVSTTQDVAGVLRSVKDDDVDVCVVGSTHEVRPKVIAELRALVSVDIVAVGGDGRGSLADVVAGARVSIDRGEPLSALLRAVRRRPWAPVEPPGPAARSEWSVRAAHRLTRREREVLLHLARGRSTVKISADLGVSTATALTHVSNLMMKLGVHSRLEAVAVADALGLVEPRSDLAS